jgi:DNA-binding transcriptional ArsR family regulator
MKVKSQDLSVNTTTLKEGMLGIKVLLNNERMKILKFIAKNGEVNVQTIYKRLRLQQSTTSAQLGRMRKYGVVNRERIGKENYYSVNFDRIRYIEEKAKEILKGN